MAFLKALIPGFILTLLVAGAIGSQGSSGGFLEISRFAVEGHDLYWSWPLFIAGTGLSWALLWMMD